MNTRRSTTTNWNASVALSVTDRRDTCGVESQSSAKEISGLWNLEVWDARTQDVAISATVILTSAPCCAFPHEGGPRSLGISPVRFGWSNNHAQPFPCPMSHVPCRVALPHVSSQTGGCDDDLIAICCSESSIWGRGLVLIWKGAGLADSLISDRQHRSQGQTPTRALGTWGVRTRYG